jgi:hypothetical protein
MFTINVNSPKDNEYCKLKIYGMLDMGDVPNELFRMRQIPSDIKNKPQIKRR